MVVYKLALGINEWLRTGVMYAVVAFAALLLTTPERYGVVYGVVFIAWNHSIEPEPENQPTLFFVPGIPWNLYTRRTGVCHTGSHGYFANRCGGCVDCCGGCV